MLQYPYNGETKSGLIRINFKLNLEENIVDYQSIGYSDHDIRSYVENNAIVLTKIDSLRKNQDRNLTLSYRNDSKYVRL
jgi:hypothetical protein